MNVYLDNGDLPTRQIDKTVLKVPDVKLTKTFKSPIYKGSNQWNALPLIVHASEDYKKFRYAYTLYV